MRTPRLRLRRPRPSDAPAIQALHADREVIRHTKAGLAGERPSLAEVRRRVLPAMMAESRRPGRGYWVAEEAGRFVGWFHLLPVAGAPGTLELGFRLRRDAWGRGLASEGARALIAAALGRWGARRVVASALVANPASIRVLEKAGLRRVGDFRFARRHPAALFARERGAGGSLDANLGTSRRGR